MASHSPDLNPTDYSFLSIMQQKTYQTHTVKVETAAGSGVDRGGSKTYRCSYWTVSTPSQCTRHTCESSMGIFRTTFAL